MTHHSDFSEHSSWARRLNRPQRSLAVALVSILLPTVIGLSILFLQLFDATASAGKGHVESAARDTLLLTGYRISVSLFYTLQEIYADPTRRDILRPLTGQLIADLDSIRKKYLDLL